MADEDDELETALTENARLKAENARLRHGKPKKADPNADLKKKVERAKLKKELHEHHAGPSLFKKMGLRGFTLLLVVLAVATAYAFDAGGRQSVLLHDLSGYLGLAAGFCVFAVLVPVAWRVLTLSFSGGAKSSGGKSGGAHH